MPTSALTAIASFEMVLFGKTAVAFGGQVIITILNGDNLLHHCKDT